MLTTSGKKWWPQESSTDVSHDLYNFGSSSVKA